ncbi:MAG TPA: hypothetical protein PKA64_18145, partial [Myxococcota bacterium]|nr:hypothetical protein [Myxococcota bacterium]
SSGETVASRHWRVRSGGRLSTARAVDVAVPRLERPADRAVDRYGQLDIYIDNVGAAGAATVVLTHPPAIEIVRVDLPGWTATHAAPGEVIDLPDAGAHAADRAISLLRGPLPADAPLRLPVVIRAWSVDSHPITTRLVATSPGTDGWLNAPYAAGEDDETGFLAWTSWVDAIAAVPSTTLTLEVGELSAGAPLDLTVTGAAPQALVTWVMGRGPDNGPCLPLDPVRCLHLSQPVRVGASRADPLGQAHLRLRAPSPLPGFQPWFQAVVASVDPEWSDAVAPTAP